MSLSAMKLVAAWVAAHPQAGVTRIPVWKARLR
jgi:hypothetical protein